MWNWYSGDGTQSPAATSGNPSAGTMSVADLTEQLAQTQQLVVQLKDLIREKDNDLRKKDQQLKEEKESSDSKVSKAKLQSKAKIASLTSQLEELKKQLASPEAQGKKYESKKGDGDQENASANRGKILVLRKRVEELESQLTTKNEELQKKGAELEAQRLRGSEMDAMLAAKEKKLAEKEAYIVDLQMAAASNPSQDADVTEVTVKSPSSPQDSDQDLQILIHNLNRKVGESEEKYSLLREQTESLKGLLNKEKSEFQEKEAMYAENIRVYQNMILEKEKDMKELSQKHDQEIFKLAAKSDATADLHQLLKALKQKLHEEEEVLSGKNQVIDVLQKELDNKDQQINEMNEKCRRLVSEKENLQSKLDAEKHIMRAQLKDMMERHETEMHMLNDRHSKTLQEMQEKHEVETQEKFQTIQQLQGQLQGLVSPGEVRAGSDETTDKEMIKLQEEIKLKTEEASKSEAKFLKMKAWSKSRIRQLDEQLISAEAKVQELSQLSSHVAKLEEEKRSLEIKLQSVADLQAFNEQLLSKLVVYEEQQRKLQADLEQVAKRADSQTSESGSVDEMQNQLLEWHEMSAESDTTPEREETSVMALRMAQIEEEREAMDSGQVELEEELSAARGVGKMRPSQRKGSKGATKLQDEFDYSSKSFEKQSLVMESSDTLEGENMGGLRAVVEELELERNQLQEQIMTLEERCQELEDRLQLQLRIESLQTENERLQSQVSQMRQQQSQESEKHIDLLSTLNDQLKGLTNRNAFLENAIVEKEQTILETTSRLDQLGAVRKALQEKETVNKELLEKLDQTEHQLEEVKKKQREMEAENSTLRQSNSELTEKVSAFKERVLIQDSSLEKLQIDLDQTNEDLDRLNSSHLEERSQLIYDLQRCEREVDVLKELLQEKDKEMSFLSVTLTEYSEQITVLKETMDFKDRQMREMSDALVKVEREHHLMKEAQTLDVQETSTKISSLTEQLREMDEELNKAKILNEGKIKDAEELIRQINENGITIKNLRQEIQTQSVTYNNHVTECSAQITSLKAQMNASAVKLSEMETNYKKEIESLKLQLENEHSEKAKLGNLLEEKSNKEQSVENEAKAAKEQCNRLVSDMLKKDEEAQQLSKHFSEKKDLCDKLSQELSDRQDEVLSLEKQIKTLKEEWENLVKDLQEKTLEFQKQIDVKCGIIKTLHSEKEELQAQYKVLETSNSDKESCIQRHLNSAEELTKKVQGFEDQNQYLCNEKETLLAEVSKKDSEISHLNQTLIDLQTKLAETGHQLSEEQKNISNLSYTKEELLARIEQISAQSSKNSSDFAAQIAGKEKEYISLESQLHEEQEVSHKLQNQIQTLERDLEEVQRNLHEKDDNLKVIMANCNTACENVTQQEEKNALLQKQVEELTKNVDNERKTLQEKDLLLASLHSQLEALTSNLERLQNEEQTVKETNVKLTEDIEALNGAMAKLQEELSHRTEESTTLRERLEMSNKDLEKLTVDRDSSLLSISNLQSQCHSLQSQVVQHQSSVDSLTQQVSSLISEREKMNSDMELLNTNLSSKLEEISVLSSHLSQQGHSILALKDQIDTVQLEKHSLLCSVQEKDALLSQKEELIQQVEKKLEGEGFFLQTISTLQNELESSLSECSVQQQKMKDQEQEMQRLMQQMQLLKDKSEEAELLKTQLSEHMEIISDLHSQIKSLRNNLDDLNDALTKKDECLKEKVDSYVNLKTQLSEIQDSLEEQKTHVEALSLENTQYKASVSEKDLAIRNSLIECDALKLKVTDKEGQCNMLIQQITDLEEINRNQNNELNELKVFTKEQETSLLAKQKLLNTQLADQTKLVSHLQNSVHELNNTIKDLQQSIVDKENVLQNLQEKYTSIHESKKELAESLLKKENEISNLLSRVDEKDTRLQALESNVQAFSSEVSLLREELDKGNSNVRSMLGTHKMKDEVISQHQKAAEVLKAELEKLNTEYQETQIQLHALTREKEEIGLLNYNLQEKCNLQSQLIENFKCDVESLNSELIKVRNMAALEIEQFQHQLESAKQEKLHQEAMLQAEKDTSLSTLEKQLLEKAETIKQLEHQLKELEEHISSEAGVLQQLTSDKADLQKQVSGQAEEIHSLKVYLETVECNLSELKQQSEKEYQRVNEQNAVLREQTSSLENKLKVKENEIQGLQKDLSFVEDKLCMLSDEKISEYNSCNQQLSYIGKVEKLSSMLSKALDYKAKVAELMKLLEAREQDLDNKSQAIVTFEKESKSLQAELQKIKEEKLGTDYAVGELAAAKVLAQQQNILKEKDGVLAEMGKHIANLQDEIKLTKEDLQKSQLTVNEGKAKALELIEEIEMKNTLIQNLNLQLSQQNKLISTISDQVKEKDSSLMQVMESMSNEMLKISSEKSTLNLELQNLQSEKSSCVLQISELSEKLQVYEVNLQQSEQMLADKELLLSNLSNEKDLQLQKFNKERENLKRKLQAALLIRKDLMQKLEKLEQSKQDDLNVEQLKILELEKTVEELNYKLKTVLKENEDLQSRMEVCKKQVLEKDAQTNEIYIVLSKKENLVVELQNQVREFQQSFSEKDGMCQEYMKIMQEKEHNFSQTKNTLKEKLKTLEEENSHLVENLENLKSCLEKAQGKVVPPTTSHQVSPNPSPATGIFVTPEPSSVEGSFATPENTIVHNNVHASLLCSQGNVESKEKHAALLASLNMSVKEFELLQKAHAELQLAYKTKCAEYEDQRMQTLSLQSQIESQEALMFHKELELTDKDKQLDHLRQKIEQVAYKLDNGQEYENLISELKANLHGKDEELLKMSSEQAQLLSKIKLLNNEIQKLSHDGEQRQEEICCLKNAMDSHLMDLEKAESVKGSMKNEIALLQKEVEACRKVNESVELTIQQIAKEKDMYYEDCQVLKSDKIQLKHDLKVRVIEVLEKDKEITVLNESLQMNVRTSGEEIEKLCKQLEEGKEEANKLRIDYDQMKEELEECISKLAKAHVEISDFRTTLTNSRKEEEIIIQSNIIQVSNNPDLNQVVPETKPALANLQGTRDYVELTCKDCLKKQKTIDEFVNQGMKTNKALEDLTEKQKRNISEESRSKDQIQRKLQAALVSRKDLLKENKALKQTVESLNHKVDELEHSLDQIQEKHELEIASLNNKNKDLLSESERISVDNENLSAACESLKSTMETIVQEKEAFSFQLNSLKDSQTVELTGWKAKHGELNKEYESLLQAYENVSDEIDKMRQVIDITKKEKHEILIKIHDLQNENQVFSTQVEENGEDIVKLRAMLESKDTEIKQLKQGSDGMPVIMEKASQFDEITEKNLQLLEENRHLQETCENLKLCLENKEKENNSLFIIKTTLDKLQVDMNMYKSDMEIKISEMSSENELLLKKITELSIKLEETEQSLLKAEAERDTFLEKARSSEALFTKETESLQKFESSISNMQLEKMNLEERVKILEDDKALLLDEIENIQEQFCTVKNERESMETELLKAVNNNSLLSDKFKSLQAQTNVLSQQVDYLRGEKNLIIREKEEQQLQVLQDLEEKVKSAQDNNRGTKSKSKELQELLKEKQQEINQLQQDSIRFQELILDLEGDIKGSNSQNETLKKELEHTSAQLTQVRNDILFLNKELTDKERALEHANIQLTKRTEFKEINGEWIIDNPAQNVNTQNILVTEGSDGIAKSLDNLDQRNSSSRNQEFDMDTHLNGVKRGVKEPKLVSQSRAEALPKLKSEQVSYQQVSESQRDDLKALQIVLSNKEEEFQQLKLECENIRADVHKHVILSEHMKQIINNKDKEISLLISAEEGEISSYLEEIQSRYRKQEGEYEQRLCSVQAQKEKSEMDCQKLEKELQNLQVTYEKAVHDKLLLSNEIEAFRKSMSSLQTDRDQLCSELQSVHQRNESVLSQKDNIIISTSAENSVLKAQLRNVLNRVDDLNAENAMLGAQLIRYREDLNQVLSLKDHQLKELLRQKLDHIKNLEQEKCDLEKQNRELQNSSVALQSKNEDLELENQKLLSKVKDQEDLIATINKEKIFETSKKKEYQNSADHQIKDLEDKFNHNIVAFGKNTFLFGSESKTAEKTEKTYSDILLENKELKSHNESFGKAMAALQNNRDSLIDDFKELQWRYASELKSEKIHGDDLERQLRDFKFQIYSLLKKNSLVDEAVLAAENQITVDQLVAEIDSLCNLLASRGSEISRLSSECTAYTQQVDAFSKAMASLQHDRERLLQQLKEPSIVQESKQGTTSVNRPTEIIESDSLVTNGSKADKLTLVTETKKSSAAESLKLRKKVQELERLLQETKSLQEKSVKEITGYQSGLAELRAERDFLVADAQALRLQFNTALADKDRRIAELHQHQDTAVFDSVLHGGKGLEKVLLVGNSASPEKMSSSLEDKKTAEQEVQRYIQEIQQRDLIIQQLNTKAVELMEMNNVLTAQMKSMSQGLKDTQMRYSDLQNQYYTLQRDLQSSQITSRSDSLIEVPPGAPQERTDVLVEIDNAELAELKRRLIETEIGYETAQQELSQLSESLAEERVRREAAEEALNCTEQKNRRVETKSSSREYEFSLQMESDDEREALIIDPTQNVVVRKIKGGTLSIRRWLRGRSLYCSKLLTSRSKSRYVFLTYLLGLHILILMCLAGVL